MDSYSERVVVMSVTFLDAARQRAADVREWDAIPIHFAALAAQMDPIVRSLLVDNVDPCSFNVDDVLCALKLDGSRHDWASRLDGSLRTVPGALSASQCAVLRDAVDAAPMEMLDTVDGLLEYQLNLEPEELQRYIGDAAYAALSQLAARCHREMKTSHSPAATSAAHAVGICLSPPLPDHAHEIFIRRYSAWTRPWFGFHHDRSSLTVNVALSDDADHDGGRLIAIVDGGVQVCDREKGTATLHDSRLLHGVTRMVGNSARYSLILFYRQICPHAGHTLLQCDAATMHALYPPDQGSYSCDMCGASASELDNCSMWHCAQGCEYDVCATCHSTCDRLSLVTTEKKVED